MSNPKNAKFLEAYFFWFTTLSAEEQEKEIREVERKEEESHISINDFFSDCQVIIHNNQKD